MRNALYVDEKYLAANSLKLGSELAIDPVYGDSHLVNLKLQIDQPILGLSQRSAQDNAGSVNRFRCNLTSKRQSGIQEPAVEGKSFNVP